MQGKSAMYFIKIFPWICMHKYDKIGYEKIQKNQYQVIDFLEIK